MKVISSTDRKYLGAELQQNLEVGAEVAFDDGFSFIISFKRNLENGHTVLGSPNYQLELEE